MWLEPELWVLVEGGEEGGEELIVCEAQLSLLLHTLNLAFIHLVLIAWPLRHGLRVEGGKGRVRVASRRRGKH